MIWQLAEMLMWLKLYKNSCQVFFFLHLFVVKQLWPGVRVQMTRVQMTRWPGPSNFQAVHHLSRGQKNCPSTKSSSIKHSFFSNYLWPFCEIPAGSSSHSNPPTKVSNTSVEEGWGKRAGGWGSRGVYMIQNDLPLIRPHSCANHVNRVKVSQQLLCPGVRNTVQRVMRQNHLPDTV